MAGTRWTSGPSCCCVPGLMRAYRAGTVALAKRGRDGRRRRQCDLPLRPEMVRHHLDEERILANVRTYLMADREQRDT